MSGGNNAERCSDDCNEIRRKIRLLQKEPDFKVSSRFVYALAGSSDKGLTDVLASVGDALAERNRGSEQQFVRALQ